MAANKSVPSCQSQNLASVYHSSSLNLIGLGNDKAGRRGSKRIFLARAPLQTPAQPGSLGFIWKRAGLHPGMKVVTCFFSPHAFAIELYWLLDSLPEPWSFTWSLKNHKGLKLKKHTHTQNWIIHLFWKRDKTWTTILYDFSVSGTGKAWTWRHFNLARLRLCHYEL